MMKKIVVLTLFLLLVGIVNTQSENPLNLTLIETDKDFYVLGEIVTINLTYQGYDYSDTSLEIITETRLYQYNGVMLPELQFVPDQEGNHTLVLRHSSGNFLDEKSFWVGEINIANVTPEINVTINQTINESVNETINQSSGNKSSRYNITGILSNDTYYVGQILHNYK